MVQTATTEVTIQDSVIVPLRFGERVLSTRCHVKPRSMQGAYEGMLLGLEFIKEYVWSMDFARNRFVY